MKIGEQLDQGLAKGISDHTKPITKAMDKVSNLTQRSFESEIAMNATGTFGRLSNAIQSTQESDSESPTPLNVKFVIEGHEFLAFVDDITKAQDRTVQLKLAY